MTKPLVSIVIPCFNGQDFVARAIDSALAQTYSPVEVIVIDDGSTDRSLDIIQSYGEQIRCHTSANRGGCAARNAGIQMARGEFVQFLDADDELHPRRLEVMVANSRKLGANSIAVSDWKTYGIGDQESVRNAPSIKPDGSIVACLRGQIQTASPLHRRGALLEIGGFDESLPACQERQLHLTLAIGGWNFVRVPESLVHVYRTRGSISDDYGNVIGNLRAILVDAEFALQNQGRLSKIMRLEFTQCYAREGRNALRLGNLKEAQAFWANALRLSPETAYLVFGRPAFVQIAKILGPVRTDRYIGGLRYLLSFPKKLVGASRAV